MRVSDFDLLHFSALSATFSSVFQLMLVRLDQIAPLESVFLADHLRRLHFSQFPYVASKNLAKTVFGWKFFLSNNLFINDSNFCGVESQKIIFLHWIHFRNEPKYEQQIKSSSLDIL